MVHFNHRHTPALSDHSDEGRPISMPISVTSARVEHYAGVIESMSRDAVRRFVQKNNRLPAPESIARYNTEMIRLMTIGRDIVQAQDVEIVESIQLNENAK